VLACRAVINFAVNYFILYQLQTELGAGVSWELALGAGVKP